MTSELRESTPSTADSHEAAKELLKKSEHSLNWFFAHHAGPLLSRRLARTRPEAWPSPAPSAFPPGPLRSAAAPPLPVTLLATPLATALRHLPALPGEALSQACTRDPSRRSAATARATRPLLRDSRGAQRQIQGPPSCPLILELTRG